MKLMIVLASLVLAANAAHAADLLMTDNRLWFDKKDQTPVKVSAEFKGATREQVIRTLAAELGTYKRVNNQLFLFPNGLNGTLKVTFSDDGVIRFSSASLLHRDLVRLNSVLAKLQNTGANSIAPEIPLAVTVRNLEGQDVFVANVTGLPIRTVREVEAGARSGRQLIFRYFLDDRKRLNRKDYDHLKQAHGDAIVSYIPANTFGRIAMVLPGESVVYHSRTFHGGGVLGRYNPGLINGEIVKVVTSNKYVEALFWKQYAPKALPDTKLLANLGYDLSSVRSFAQRLAHDYPNGFVIKGTNESNTNFSILTDKVDFVKEYQAYKSSDFEAFKHQTAIETAGMDEDNFYQALQQHPNFLGWRISQYMKSPEKVVVQNRVRINREFRVEVSGGRVLRGATIDRHNWLLELKGLPFETSSPEIIKGVENWTQSVVNQLPPELRETNFAFDTALLQDGSYLAIETNAGSESGFLADQDSSVEVLNQDLREYPSRVRQGEVRGSGLSSAQQMKYLEARFKEWNIDPAVHFPQLKFEREKIATSFEPVSVRSKYKLARPAILTCTSLFDQAG